MSKQVLKITTAPYKQSIHPLNKTCCSKHTFKTLLTIKLASGGEQPPKTATACAQQRRRGGKRKERKTKPDASKPKPPRAYTAKPQRNHNPSQRKQKHIAQKPIPPTHDRASAHKQQCGFRHNQQHSKLAAAEPNPTFLKEKGKEVEQNRQLRQPAPPNILQPINRTLQDIKRLSISALENQQITLTKLNIRLALRAQRN